jgi:hypothetical protein
VKKIVVLLSTIVLLTGCTLFGSKIKTIDANSKLGKNLINSVKDAYSWIDYKNKVNFNTDDLRVRLALDNVKKNSCYQYYDNTEEPKYLCDNIGKEILQYVNKDVVDSKVKELFNSKINTTKYIGSNKYYSSCEDINTNSYFVYDDISKKYIMNFNFSCAVANYKYGEIVSKKITENNKQYVVELKYMFISNKDLVKNNDYTIAYYQDVEMNKLLVGKKLNEKKFNASEYKMFIKNNTKKLWTYKYTFDKLSNDKFNVKSLEVKVPK